MDILGGLTTTEFIQQYWQKKPLLIRNALPQVQHLIDGDDLAGLAGEDQVESRLIITEQDQWHCEHGPFPEQYWETLPAKHWTLLVQAVDQWIPEVTEIRDHFNFLPHWRFDDIMISYATAGGGVGPHFDYYDVFLLQTAGQRRWQIGQHCDQHTPLREHPELRLLSEFISTDDYQLSVGDMLYLPPGVAHWGTALSDDCITCSIGFRTPSHKDILLAAIEQLTDERRYQDTVSAIDNDPFCINAEVQNILNNILNNIDVEQLKTYLLAAFAAQVTEPRYPELIEAEHADNVPVKQDLHFQHHPASRFAYRITGEQAELYVDGETYNTSIDFARAICHVNLASQDELNNAEKTLLLKLLKQGNLILV